MSAKPQPPRKSLFSDWLLKQLNIKASLGDTGEKLRPEDIHWLFYVKISCDQQRQNKALRQLGILIKKKHTYTHTHIHIHTHLHVRVLVCVCVYVRACVRAHVGGCTPTAGDIRNERLGLCYVIIYT